MKLKKSVLALNALQLYLVMCLLCSCSPQVMNSEPLEQTPLKKINNIPPGELRYKLQFVTKEVAWLANETKLWLTTNGGRNWEPSQFVEGPGQEIINLEMLDSQTGWVLRYSGLYKTEDSGQSWIRTGLPMDFPKGEVRKIKFSKDARIGWVIGGIYRQVSREKLLTGGFRNNVISPDFNAVLYGTVLRTDDGGKTWHELFLSKTAGRFLHLDFWDSVHGFVLGDAGAFYTDDGGKTWVEPIYKRNGVSQKLSESLKNNLSCASFVDSGVGWLSCEDGHVFKSLDGGHTWFNSIEPGDIWPEGTLNAFFQKIHFTDTVNGWGLGSDGSLHKTNDGGSTWVKVGTEIRFQDVSILDSTLGWAVAKEGLFRINLRND